MFRILITAVFLCSVLFGFSQTEINLAGKFTYNQELSDVWGYTSPLGKEYALVGVYNGFSIVDVSDANNYQEVFFKPGYPTIWRDIKVYNQHAYITNENNGGLAIVDLSNLPSNNSLPVDSFLGMQYPFTRAHNIWIDEQGFAYLFGANNGKGGAIILDLNQNPKAPVEVGQVDFFYLHDGFVRNDTLWGSAIYEGLQVMVDVSDKQNPVVLTTFETPGKFAHNCWPSNNGNFVFTTDEIPNGYIGSFDVTDFSNPVLLDQFKVGSISNPIPHNTFVVNQHLVTAYYSEGIHILDAKNPGGLIEVGRYDTSPQYQNGFHGAWGVYPYFSSGKMLIADIEEGLFVFDVTLDEAAYLAGEIRDTITNNPIENCTILVVGSRSFKSQEFGNYFAGASNDGDYEVRFIKPGYLTKTVKNINLTRGNTTTLNVFLTAVDAPLSAENTLPINQQQKTICYPNPFSHQINLANSSSNQQLQLLNMKGQIVAKGSGKLVQLQDLPKGPYLIKVFENNSLMYKQVIFKN